MRAGPVPALAILAALVAVLLGSGARASEPEARSRTDPDAEIAHLLEFVASSDCRMLRNGRLHAPGEARAHLERKLAWLRDRDRVASAEDFIDLAASRSSLSGRAYAVHCEGTPEQPSRDWLRRELERLRQTPAPAPLPAP